MALMNWRSLNFLESHKFYQSPTNNFFSIRQKTYKRAWIEGGIVKFEIVSAMVNHKEKSL